jgi:hypothetical protein
MENIVFLTLADKCNVTSKSFEVTFKKCFFDAAKSIPQEALVKALWGISHAKVSYKKAA